MCDSIIYIPLSDDDRWLSFTVKVCPFSTNNANNIADICEIFKPQI